MTDELKTDFSTLLGLVVHDLRNPTATISANLDFLGEQKLDEFGREALDDVVMATDELRRGLELLGWIARWLGGDTAINVGATGDIVPPLTALAEKLDAAFSTSEPRIETRAVPAVTGIVELFLRASDRHARRKPKRVELALEGESVVIAVIDGGEAIAAEHRPHTFTLSGQKEIKARPDARYARYAGYVAASAAVEALGGSIGADDAAGEARFWIRIPLASS